MEARYRPLSERQPDTQYLDLVDMIHGEGERVVHPHQAGMGRLTHLTLPHLIYKFENGFPVLTERALPFWRSAIGELVGFMNGATTSEELKKFGCPWWDMWVTEKKCAYFGLQPGDLGWASYGGAFGKFPMPDGGSFNQFTHLLKQMKESPSLSTHCVTSWIPFGVLQHSELQRKVVVAPCHGNFLKFTIINNRLTMHHVQRSADMPVGAVLNIIQYAALMLMISQLLKVEPYQYVHIFLDAQIYENQLPQVEELLLREPRSFPRVWISNKSIDNILDFRAEHFEIDEYHPHPGIKFPVTE